MNRLQKKCLVTTAGFHLLLVVILLVGPGFFTSKSKPEGASFVTIFPETAIATERTAVANPPARNPNVPANPTPSTPRVTPSMELVTRNTRVPPTPTRNPTAEQRQRADAIANAIENLKKNFTTGTDVVVPNAGEAVDPSYAAVVKECYSLAWIPASDTPSDDANTRVSVTIGSDGTVKSARILNPSGDARVDASVQQTLDRVKFVAPFPDGAKEKQRTFIINFNLKAKRLG